MNCAQLIAKRKQGGYAQHAFISTIGPLDADADYVLYPSDDLRAVIGMDVSVVCIDERVGLRVAQKLIPIVCWAQVWDMRARTCLRVSRNGELVMARWKLLEDLPWPD